MAYKKIKLGEFFDIKLSHALKNLGFSVKDAQRFCDKGRFFDENEEILKKNSIINGELFMIDYVCEPKGLEPIFECEEFACFDKPSGVLSHPSGRNSPYNMYDEIWSKYGKNACVAHRLDAETSGILIVAKNKNSAKILKALFENRQVLKSYQAFVEGEFDINILNKFKACNFKNYADKFSLLGEFDGYFCDESIEIGPKVTDAKYKMIVSNSGKEAVTLFKKPEFFPEFNASFVELSPLTGRQHQLRVHMFHMKHRIIGDPLYGLNREIIEQILDKELDERGRILKTGAKRLLLHSNEISFNFNGKNFNIKSKFDAKNEFLKELKSYSI